jgi:hypothetical protein
MTKTKKGAAKLKEMTTKEGMTKTRKRAAKLTELYHPKKKKLHKEGDKLL